MFLRHVLGCRLFHPSHEGSLHLAMFVLQCLGGSTITSTCCCAHFGCISIGLAHRSIHKAAWSARHAVHAIFAKWNVEELVKDLVLGVADGFVGNLIDCVFHYLDADGDELEVLPHDLVADLLLLSNHDGHVSVCQVAVAFCNACDWRVERLRPFLQRWVCLDGISQVPESLEVVLVNVQRFLVAFLGRGILRESIDVDEGSTIV
mmetsp:Transcript_2553/g.7086  ORF Transcript_2553/g.7086 Transcript_2553/m.7086 type:complete len:205 (+) Transcript_2553:1384-1998(+)